MVDFEDWYRERIKTFIFKDKPYPERPFRSKSWVGVAFNRDKNELCAPAFFWRAILSASRKHLGERLVFCVSVDELPRGVDVSGGSSFENNYERLSDFLLTDFSYLAKIYIAGASERWAYWGDQDFSIFGGDADFMSEVFSMTGGEVFLHKLMLDQFDVNNDADSGMAKYLADILRAPN